MEADLFNWDFLLCCANLEEYDELLLILKLSAEDLELPKDGEFCRSEVAFTSFVVLLSLKELDEAMSNEKLSAVGIDWTFRDVEVGALSFPSGITSIGSSDFCEEILCCSSRGTVNSEALPPSPDPLLLGLLA